MAAHSSTCSVCKGGQCGVEPATKRSQRTMLSNATAATMLLVGLGLAVKEVLSQGNEQAQKFRQQNLALCRPCADSCGPVIEHAGARVVTLLPGPTECRDGFCVPQSTEDPAAFCGPLVSASWPKQEQLAAASIATMHFTSRKVLQDDKELKALSASLASTSAKAHGGKPKHSRRQLEDRFEKYFNRRAEHEWNVGQGVSKASHYLAINNLQED